MQIIYGPRGKAGEYARLALNPYKGCTHKCRYCYGPASTRTSKEDYYRAANPKKDVVEKVRSDCKYLIKKGGDIPEIFLSFVGDCYQPEEKKLGLTREVIKVLSVFDFPFTILTKSNLAERDFDLLKEYPEARFGVSFSVWRKDKSKYWEPSASISYYRYLSLRYAKDLGIKTWVSLEPVIDPQEALSVIRNIHKYVDYWKVGKINHHPEIEKKVDWFAFREEVVDLFAKIGADYYLKDSLRDL